MTDTNKEETTELRSCFPKKESFESYLKKLTKNTNMGLIQYAKLKQLHDQSLIDLKYEMKSFKWEGCQNALKEKDKRISKLQAENELLRDLISKLPEILISRFGFDDQIDNANKFTIKIYQEEIKGLKQ